MSPWPDQPKRIAFANYHQAFMESGDYVRRVLQEAQDKGICPITEPPGVYVHVDVRCSYQEAGKYQHVRDAWHHDQAYLGFIYIEGPGPTEMRKGHKTWSVKQATWTPYHQVEHRCPPQPEPGWRLFVRVLWCNEPPRGLVVEK